MSSCPHYQSLKYTFQIHDSAFPTYAVRPEFQVELLPLVRGQSTQTTL